MWWDARAAAAAALTIMLGAVSPVTEVEASPLVFGSTAAQSCYESARFGSGVSGLRDCDAALRDETLSRRDESATYVNRGIIYNRARRFPEAIDDFNAALDIDPDLGPAFLNRGNTYFFQRAFEQALADYNRSIELGTRNLHAAYFNRGLIFDLQGDRDAARADFERSLELKPDFQPAAAKLAAYDGTPLPEAE